MPDVTPYAGRWLLVTDFVGWALCTLYVVACWTSPSIVGDAGCELGSGSSVFGEASRSWLPPGTTCTYDLSNYGLSADVVIGPSPLRLLVLAVALVGLPVLAYLRRLLRECRSPVNV